MKQPLNLLIGPLFNLDVLGSYLGQHYIKTFIKCGLTITDLHEPVPTAEQSAISVDIAWMQKIPIFLFWELRK